MQPAFERVGAAVEGDFARRDRVAVDIRIPHATGQAERDGCENLPFKPGDMAAHGGANSFERGACGPRGEVTGLGRCIGKTALPGDVWFAVISAGAFDQNFPRWKAEAEANCAGAAAGGEHGFGLAGMGEVMGAFDQAHLASSDVN